MKIILTRLAVEVECDRCHKPGSCLRIDLFTGVLGAQSGPICLLCLEHDNEVEGQLLLVELAPAEPRRGPVLRRQRRLSQNQEIDIANALGGRVQKASGALPGLKGDVRRKGVVRVEAKYTEARSYTLKLDELEKIASECHGRERPVLVLDFKERGTGKLRDRFAVVRFDDAKEMFNAAGHDR